jgi:hypothetical protein
MVAHSTIFHLLKEKVFLVYLAHYFIVILHLVKVDSSRVAATCRELLLLADLLGD